MKITIHRGSDQIGGCVTEYEFKGWRLFVNYGEELPGSPKTGDLQVEGLTHGDLSKSALLITHYHGDHIGNVTKLPEVLPIYMGEVAREAGQNFTFGPFKIRPVTVNHSAFDAYAFRIEADGVSAYHTGDFRLYSYRSGKFFKMLEQYVGKVDYVVYHTNGHIDMNDVRELFRHLQPKAIIPIHTDSPDEFAKLFCDEWPIITLNDGQSISPISASKADACSARIFCTKELEDGMVYENREEWEEAHGLDEKSIGVFKTIEDSKFALDHTLYRPAAIVGYVIEEEEDLSPFEIQTFDASKSLLAAYTYGGHQPGGAKYQEACRFAAGEKALAVFHATYYAVVPVKVVGPITPESEREYWEKNEFYDTYEDYVKDWDDWHWDSVVVHPLVKLKSEYEQMTDTEIVPRVYLFPYGNTDEWGVTYSDNGKTL